MSEGFTMIKLLKLLIVLILLSGCSQSVSESMDSDSMNEFSETEEVAQEFQFPEDGMSYTEGGASGYMEEFMHTAFFDFVVLGANLIETLETYTPSKGMQILEVEIAIKNTMRESIPMFDTDFQIQWNDDSEDAYGWPITSCDPELIWENQPWSAVQLSDDQLPVEYELAIHQQMKGKLYFEVPEGTKDFNLSFQEYFENDERGDVYFIYFTANKK